MTIIEEVTVPPEEVFSMVKTSQTKARIKRIAIRTAVVASLVTATVIAVKIACSKNETIEDEDMLTNQ